MSETQLRDECITIFAAGYETTARTMSFAWYTLASNPQVKAKLHAELDQTLGDRSPTIDDLPKLSYCSGPPGLYREQFLIESRRPN